jgi:hypothetical protein
MVDQSVDYLVVELVVVLAVDWVDQKVGGMGIHLVGNLVHQSVLWLAQRMAVHLGYSRVEYWVVLMVDSLVVLWVAVMVEQLAAE